MREVVNPRTRRTLDVPAGTAMDAAFDRDRAARSALALLTLSLVVFCRWRDGTGMHSRSALAEYTREEWRRERDSNPR
jgi:hypothetical protein